MGDPAGENSRDLLEEASSIVELAKQVQDAVSSLASKSWNEEQILRKKALILDSDFHRIQSGIEKEIRLRRISHKDAERLEDELYKAKCIIDASEVSFLLPPKAHGTFMKMFLGSIDVRINRKDVRMKVKEEYNTYKDRTAFLFILFPSTLLLLRSWVWNGCFPTLPVQLYQAWLLFLYTSLALRENILRVNGSDIRPWWIYHHYCAMLMSVISLTWEIKGEPDDGHKQQAVQLFLAWTIMQGLSMLLQNRYQRQRLYTRIALGKAKRMDVVWGETAGVEGQLLLLCPILFILQGFEAFIGLLLLKTPPSAFRSEWQVVVCGVLLVLMAVGNFTNTVQTLVVKSRFKAKMKKSRANKM